MKRFFKNLGWVCLGIFLQFKFNALYGIVFLENLNFHERTYYVKMQETPIDGKTGLITIGTTVHHSLGPDYFAYVYIPSHFKVLNQPLYQGTEAIEGYLTYKMDMKRRYRDVLATADFIITPANGKKDIPPAPIIVHFENMKQQLHKDATYQLAVKNKKIHLEGPELVEVKYPQKLGM